MSRPRPRPTHVPATSSGSDPWFKVLNSQRFAAMRQKELAEQEKRKTLEVFPCLHCKREKPCLREYPLTTEEWFQLGALAYDIQSRLADPIPTGDPVIDKALKGLVYPFCGYDCEKMFQDKRARSSGL